MLESHGMGQEVVTGVGHGGITCVLQLQLSSLCQISNIFSHIYHIYQPGSSASDYRARGPRFYTWSSHLLLLFLLPMIQEGHKDQLLAKVCALSTGYRLGGLSLPQNSVVWLTDHPNMTIVVYRGLKARKHQEPYLP